MVTFLKMITLKDVARKAQLHVSTISHILHSQDARYSFATRQRVEEIAKQLGYRPDTLARSLTLGKTNTIGVVGHDFVTSINMERVDAIAAFAQRQGYHILLAGGGLDILSGGEKELVDGLLSRRIDGLIIFIAAQSDISFYRELGEKGIPIVLTTHVRIPNLPCVTVNIEQGYYEATRHLLEQGHRKIALAVATQFQIGLRNRFHGYQRALKSYGVTETEKLLPASGHMSISDSYEFTKEQIRRRQRPTAIIYANDEHAIAGLHALEEAGMDVPKEISVVGCDDLPFAQYTSPPLTTVYQPKGEVSQAAIELLIKQIDGQLVRKNVAVPLLTKLIIRQSTGPVPR